MLYYYDGINFAYLELFTMVIYLIDIINYIKYYR
jgi:hypothetical protein